MEMQLISYGDQSKFMENKRLLSPPLPSPNHFSFLQTSLLVSVSSLFPMMTEGRASNQVWYLGFFTESFITDEGQNTFQDAVTILRGDGDLSTYWKIKFAQLKWIKAICLPSITIHFSIFLKMDICGQESDWEKH